MWVALLRTYGKSCGLLLLPIFVWNLALTPSLPAPWGTDEFQRDIPLMLSVAENATRWMVLGMPFLMPLEVMTVRERRGLLAFGVGVGLYCVSWVALIAAPNSAWAMSAIGALAPAYTPAVWLGALAVLGRRLYWGRWYRWWMYLLPTAGFLAAHIAHAAIVYARTY